MKIDLHWIAQQLEGLEETIISKLIDRAQFRANAAVYQPGKSGFNNEPGLSLFGLRLRHQEEMDARFGRYCVPEERPFTADLPAPGREVNLPDTGLCLDNLEAVNLTGEIRAAYLALVPRLCAPGDDGHYGSSVEHDIYALQAIARRIHFGALYVAESKFSDDPRGYSALIEADDEEAITERLTRRAVEEQIIERVREKVSYAQQRVNKRVRYCVEAETVMQFYRDYIIPLTKRGEVLYLMNRRREN